MMNTDIRRIEGVLPMSSKEWVSYTIEEPIDRKPSSLAIICHGLTGDKVGPQKFLLALACRLAQRKIRVVRFDFRGSGLSSGSFLETTFSSMKQDLLFVIESFRKKYDVRRIHLMGVSTGSLIPILVAPQMSDCSSVTLISNGCPEDIAFEMDEGDKVALRGGQLYLKRSYFEDRIQMKPRTRFLKKINAPVSFVLGSLDLKHYIHADSAEKEGYQVFRIENGDHLYTDSQIREIAVNTVCNIIEKADL